MFWPERIALPKLAYRDGRRDTILNGHVAGTVANRRTGLHGATLEGENWRRWIGKTSDRNPRKFGQNL